MDQTPWSTRQLDTRLKGKQAGKEARSRAGADLVPGTKPSHPLADFAGEYEHPAYGIMKISLKDGSLLFDFHKAVLPLTHFHYDRFDTPDDEELGKWSVSFQTNPQGDIDKAVMSLDEAEAVFTRKAEMLDAKMLAQLAGTYEAPNGLKFQAVLKEDKSLNLVFPGQSDQKLVPYKGLKFRIKDFSDVIFEFVVENGQVKSLKEIEPSGVFVYLRK
jgi:hypothetical protein